MHELIAGNVPDPADRLDFEHIDRPLDDVCAPDLASLQERLRAYVLDDLVRHVDDHHTAELGAFVGLLSVFAQVAELAGSTALTPRSRAQDLAWCRTSFSSLASGPPGPRLRQLLALSRAGFVVFLGAGLRVSPVEGGFRATSASLDGVAVTARTFVEARLSSPSVSRSDDPMLAGLHAEGLLDEETLREEHTGRDAGAGPAVHAADAAVAHSGAAVTLHNTGLVRVRSSDFRLVDAEGRPDPRAASRSGRTPTSRLPGAFTRPNTNALSFRANDALARAALAQLAEAGLRVAS